MILQILIAFDQLFNTFLGGMADETLSARAYRMRKKGQRYWGWTANVIDMLFFWQPGHCKLAHMDEKNRAQLPRSYQIED